MAKKSAQERQAAKKAEAALEKKQEEQVRKDMSATGNYLGTRRASGIIAEVDDDGYVTIDGNKIAYEVFLKATEDYVKVNGGDLRVEGRAVHYTTPAERVFPKQTFEEHPLFRRRLVVKGLDAFTTMSPPSGLEGAGLVSRVCFLLVHCPGQPPAQSWYHRRWKIEHVAGAVPSAIAKTALRAEETQVKAAELMLVELGVVSADPGYSIGGESVVDAVESAIAEVEDL